MSDSDYDDNEVVNHLFSLRKGTASRTAAAAATSSSAFSSLSSSGLAGDHRARASNQSDFVINIGDDPADRAGRNQQGVSTAHAYGPKFIEVFQGYCTFVQTPVGITNHLMSCCLDHLVAFSCWMREDTGRSDWVRQCLDDNVDLRPEVRNGLAMILVYGFSAAKAAEDPSDGQDMFSVLQDSETGLGIVNKTSLKIYNDPFQYFAFLKCCL
jgi:hypothetical protein